MEIFHRDGDEEINELTGLLGRCDSCEGDAAFSPLADFDVSGCIDNPELYTLLDFYGKTIDDEIWAKYEWDAENRLIAVSPGEDAASRTTDDIRLEFKYDYMGRRVEKRVIPWNPSLNGGLGDWDDANPDSVRRFVYHSWQPLLEYTVSDAGGPAVSMTIQRKFTWGLDLSQTLSGAGGIGGLLACEDTHDPANPTDDKSYYYFYDATGNVGQVIDAADGSIAAAYEYDPYGNVITSSGDYAGENPFRFSTKYWDDETGWGIGGIGTIRQGWGGGLAGIRSANKAVRTYWSSYATIRSSSWICLACAGSLSRYTTTAMCRDLSMRFSFRRSSKL